MRVKGFAMVICAGIILLSGGARAQGTNLLALGEGALPVVEPPSYGGWEPVNIIDDSPGTAWASESGTTSNITFVFALVAPGTIETFEFDCTGIDGKGRGAKDVTVEVSPVSKQSGFVSVLRASLVEGKPGQRFAATKNIEGRWVRLTIVNNHGDQQYTELGGLRGYGRWSDAAQPVQPTVEGTYSTNWNDFHLRQQGSAISGCYEHDGGLFEGTIEGRVAKLTWKQAGGAKQGPAVFVFTPDSRAFRGYWWYDSDKGRKVDGDWNGQRSSAAAGSCPHWSGSVGGELQAALAAEGRARLYGILFDTASDRIRPESFATLDEVLRLLSEEPSWSLTIEGHTDSTGTPEHNRGLSEQRAKSVKAYLAGKGVAAGRLTTVGFGQSKPVADNATELGRAQNRRVELVKR